MDSQPSTESARYARCREYIAAIDAFAAAEEFSDVKIDKGAYQSQQQEWWTAALAARYAIEKMYKNDTIDPLTFRSVTNKILELNGWDLLCHVKENGRWLKRKPTHLANCALPEAARKLIEDIVKGYKVVRTALLDYLKVADPSCHDGTDAPTEHDPIHSRTNLERGPSVPSPPTAAETSPSVQLSPPSITLRESEVGAPQAASQGPTLPLSSPPTQLNIQYELSAGGPESLQDSHQPRTLRVATTGQPSPTATESSIGSGRAQTNFLPLEKAAFPLASPSPEPPVVPFAPRQTSEVPPPRAPAAPVAPVAPTEDDFRRAFHDEAEAFIAWRTWLEERLDVIKSLGELEFTDKVRLWRRWLDYYVWLEPRADDSPLASLRDQTDSPQFGMFATRIFEIIRNLQRRTREALDSRGLERIEAEPGSPFISGVVERSDRPPVPPPPDKEAWHGTVSHIIPGEGGYRLNGKILIPTVAVAFSSSPREDEA